MEKSEQKSEHNKKCAFCDYTCSRTYNLTRHQSTCKHQKSMFVHKKVSKSEQVSTPIFTNDICISTPETIEKKCDEKVKNQCFPYEKGELICSKINEHFCIFCDFKCSCNYAWNRHINTYKHQTNSKYSTTYKCVKCNTRYDKYNSYWRHKKRCTGDDTEISQTISDASLNIYMTTLNRIIEENANNRDINNNIYLQTLEKIFEQNNSIMRNFMENSSQLIELCKQNVTKTNVIHNCTVNSSGNKNSFNLNFFLNEQCKDAINLIDFVNSLKIGLTELENTAKLGYEDGITKIIMDGLNDIELFKRPIHCTDVKRETLYVRENDKWKKEDEDKKRLMNAIKTVSHKILQQLSVWQQINPGCMDLNTKLGEQNLLMSSRIVSGNNLTIGKNVTMHVAVKK